MTNTGKWWYASSVLKPHGEAPAAPPVPANEAAPADEVERASPPPNVDVAKIALHVAAEENNEAAMRLLVAGETNIETEGLLIW